MKHIKHLTNKFKLPLIAVLSFALVGVGLWQYVHAAPNQLYLSPGSASVLNGNNTTVGLRITPGSPVDGVESTITYDASKLEFVSIDSASSAFNVKLTESGGSGTVTVIRGSLSGTVSADSLVSNITFKALVGSGTATLSLSGNATSGGSYTNPGTSGATITLTSPSTPPPSGGGGGTTTPPSSGGSTSGGTKPSTGSSTPKPSGSTTPSSSGQTPTPENPPATEWSAKPKDVEFNKSVLTIASSKPIIVYVVFGPDPSQLLTKTPETPAATTHDIKLDDQMITPGVKYYYKVIAKDAKGAVTETAVESFTTKGYTVKMSVKDGNGKALAKKKFTLHSDPMDGTTDASGAVTFANVAPGDHKLQYEQGGKVYSENITVASKPINEAADGTQSAEEQELPVVFAELKSSGKSVPIALPITVVVMLVAAVAVAFLYVRRKNQQMFAPSPQPAFTPTATSSAQAKTTEELIREAPGVDRPDPGSTIAPKK